MAAYTEGQELAIAEAVSKRIDEYWNQGHDPAFGLAIASKEGRE